MTCLTGTPESSAARSLPPTAYSQRPKGARAMTSATTAVKMIMSHTDVGSPRGRETPRKEKPVLPKAFSPARSG